MNLLHKIVICLSVGALLASLGSDAAAQSSEYRRGYEQGYRDALGAQQRDDYRESGRVMILSARYGIRERACDASESIRRIVGWRRGADFIVNNNLCGDPAPGRLKNLYIEYRCPDGQEQRMNARENELISLYCR